MVVFFHQVCETDHVAREVTTQQMKEAKEIPSTFEEDREIPAPNKCATLYQCSGEDAALSIADIQAHLVRNMEYTFSSLLPIARAPNPEAIISLSNQVPGCLIIQKGLLMMALRKR